MSCSTRTSSSRRCSHPEPPYAYTSSEIGSPSPKEIPTNPAQPLHPRAKGHLCRCRRGDISPVGRSSLASSGGCGGLMPDEPPQTIRAGHRPPPVARLFHRPEHVTAPADSACGGTGGDCPAVLPMWPEFSGAGARQWNNPRPSLRVSPAGTAGPLGGTTRGTGGDCSSVPRSDMATQTAKRDGGTVPTRPAPNSTNRPPARTETRRYSPLPAATMDNPSRALGPGPAELI
jgi:hypothetical protein